MDGLDVRQTELSSVCLYLAIRARPEERQDDGSWVKCVPLPWVNEGMEDGAALPDNLPIFSEAAVQGTASKLKPDK